MDSREQRVRDEAYRLWVEAGRPDGDPHEHWYEAERRVSASEKAGGEKAKDKASSKPKKIKSAASKIDARAAKASEVAGGPTPPPAPKRKKVDGEGAASAMKPKLGKAATKGRGPAEIDAAPAGNAGKKTKKMG